MQSYEVVDGSRPHDVAPAVDGGVWFTGQRAGFLGHLNPSAQVVTQVPLGEGSAPHGVIVGSDGDAWVTDGGLNAIVRVNSRTVRCGGFRCPPAARAPTSTPRCSTGRGCCGSPARPVYGRLDPQTGRCRSSTRRVARGPPASPPHLTARSTTPPSRVTTSGASTRPPARRRYSSRPRPRRAPSRLGGQHRPPLGQRMERWQTGRVRPGKRGVEGMAAAGPSPQHMRCLWTNGPGLGQRLRREHACALRPETETFTAYQLPGPASNVRQILGRPGEVWGAASALDQLVVVRNS